MLFRGLKNDRGRLDLAADKIEDAKFLNLNKAQQLSTSRPDLIQTKHVETENFPQKAGNRLGHMCAPFWCIL
jgi:hypothetical protein